MRHIIMIIFILSAGNIVAQYAPELDVRGTDDTADGGELQLATPTGTNFLRLYSGRLGDPSPHLYFSNQDTFYIATGGADFAKFSDRLAIFGDGKVRVADLSGEGMRAVKVSSDGIFETSVDTCFLSIPASAFHRYRDDQSTVTRSFSFETYNETVQDGWGVLIAPIFLPHKSRVLSTTYYFSDEDVVNDFDLSIIDYQVSSYNSATFYAQTNTAGASGLISSKTSNDEFNVDNQNRAYSIFIATQTDGTMGPLFKMKSVVIKYVK